jgi:hypothetical protein
MAHADLKEWLGTAPLALTSQLVQAHVGSIADAVLTAAKFAAGAFDAVWSVAARLLTAGTNIVLAKGTGVTGFTDLDAAGVRTAVGLATNNLDTQLGTLATPAQVNAQCDQALADYDGPTNAEMEARTLLAAAYGTAASQTTILARLPVAFVSGSVNDPSATTTGFIGDSGLSATDDFYNDAFLVFTSGALAGLGRPISDYVGASKTFTVGGFPAAPANGVTFVIIGRSS